MKLPSAPLVPILLISAALHLGIAAVLARLPAASAPRLADVELELHLANPPETPRPPMIIMAALPEPPAPEPTPGPAKPPTIDEQTMRELAEERDRLREELERARNPESFPPLPAPPEAALPPPSASSPPRQGNLGTIRELNLQGFPDHAVGQVMLRYRMSVKYKIVQGGSNQSFLSSAASNSGDTFYADRNSPAGLYQVFELSSAAVAKMSQLEEQAIRARGMEPAQTHVKRIKFGIVQSGANYDLGVQEIDAEPI